MMKNKTTAGSWLSSDEVFLQQIAADEVRAKAKQDGFNERLVFQIDASFDWNQVEQALNNRSLFSDKQLVELRFLQDKFSDADRKALQACCEKLNPDILLLILSHKIEAQTKKAKWFLEITNKINFVPIWPINPQQYLSWLKARSEHYQLKIEQSALQLLAKQTQGNVLAADQIMQQLSLIPAQAGIHIAELAQNAIQTDLFTFVDIFLNAQNANTLKHLALLKAQGVEPILIIWALARELRTLNAMQLGENPYVWPSRQALIHQALKLFPSAKIHKLMQQLAEIDLYIKGAKPGDPWLALERLILC
ncbi:MAG: DNA polymerase III subunit delta [Legionellales bacterium]|jgi:DNA polymerase-3 subunit delta